MPSDTWGAPFSTRASVARPIMARWAMSVVGMRRRRRASAMSSPRFFNARLTGSGKDGKAFDRIYRLIDEAVTDHNVSYIEHYFNPKAGSFARNGHYGGSWRIDRNSLEIWTLDYGVSLVYDTLGDREQRR